MNFILLASIETTGRLLDSARFRASHQICVRHRIRRAATGGHAAAEPAATDQRGHAPLFQEHQCLAEQRQIVDRQGRVHCVDELV